MENTASYRLAYIISGSSHISKPRSNQVVIGTKIYTEEEKNAELFEKEFREAIKKTARDHIAENRIHALEVVVKSTILG